MGSYSTFSLFQSAEVNCGENRLFKPLKKNFARDGTGYEPTSCLPGETCLPRHHLQNPGDHLGSSPLVSPNPAESCVVRGTAGGILQKQRSPHGKVAFGRKPERQPPSLVVSGSH